MDSCLRTFLWTFSLSQKWQSISKYFILLWKVKFDAMWISFCESQYEISYFLHMTPKSFKRYKSHCNSHVVVDKARYSASEDDLEIVCCFLVIHDTREFPKKKRNPMVDLLELEQPAHSAST